MAKKEKRKPYREQVKDKVREEFFSFKDVRNAFENSVPDGTLGWTLSALCKEGSAERIGPGRYRWLKPDEEKKPTRKSVRAQKSLRGMPEEYHLVVIHGIVCDGERTFGLVKEG